MEAICVVLAITAFFMLALTLEAVIFGGGGGCHCS